MTLNEARRFAIKMAAELVRGSDLDQFWGQEVADEANADPKMEAMLTKVQFSLARSLEARLTKRSRADGR